MSVGKDWVQVGFFAAGLAIGAIAGAVIVTSTLSPARGGSQAAPAVAVTSHKSAACPAQPLVAVAGPADGRYMLPSDLSGYVSTDTRAFIVMGEEAAADGRMHDAEIAYLMSCRVADRFRGAGSVEAADARLRLARHYEELAAAKSTPGADCGALLRRAEELYGDTLQIYQASYGKRHEKSRGAEQALAGVRKALVLPANNAPAVVAAASPAPVTPVAPPAPEPGPAAAASPVAEKTVRPQAPVPAPSAARTAPRKDEMARANLRAQGVKAASVQLNPSFDCAKARSASERLICSDAELARLDRELGYLQTRARHSTRDSWAFREQSEQEWRRREASCRDRACLLRWYAQRRHQLMSDIESG